MPASFSNNQPIYLQIVDQIKIKIIAGEYEPGDKLPSVREMALIMQVNPNTMQRAYSYLEMEGLVYTQRTNGRYVCQDVTKIEQVKQLRAQQEVSHFIQTMKLMGINKEEIIKILESVR